MSVVDERLEEILRELDEEEQDEGLADLSPPMRQRIQGQSGKGLLASWFDPEAREEANHARELRRIERSTQIKLYQIKAQEVIEKAEIHKEAEVENYRHRAAAWKEVSAI